MNPRFLATALFLLFAIPARAQFLTPEKVDWQAIRDHQPEGVSLKMELPGTQFRQGEIIDATLLFSNTSNVLLHLWTSSGDASGRMPDIAFFATGVDGKQVGDPLRWYFERGGMGGGLGNYKDLGDWKITLPINQWMTFSQPGTYKLFAYSNRVQKGDRFVQSGSQNNRVELVSDPVTIMIVPLSPSEERRIIAEAQAALAASDKGAARAVGTLRYLGTPASRAALLPLLGNPSASFEATMALYAAPNPAAEAPVILEAVRSGKLKFDQDVIFGYATLKTADLIHLPATPPRKEEMEALGQKYQAAWKAANEEITAAATAASGGKGPDYYQTLMVSLCQDPVKRPQIRAELAKVQLDLSPEQAGIILGGWSDFGGEEFLPLVRKFVAEPYCSPEALKALVALKPDEARALIIEDIQRQPPRYVIPKAASSIANRVLLSLPAVPIPELEAYFRSQLAKEEPRNLDLLMAAISRYGTPALLPDVIKLYTPKEGRWACDIQGNVLRFWVRCDPAAGLEAVKRALASRAPTRCYTSVLSEVFLDSWNEAALPIVAAALDDPDPEVVFSAIKVLEAHADGRHLAPSIAALQRVSSGVTKANSSAYYGVRGAAQMLLQSPRWKPDASQKQALEAISALRPE